MLNLRPYQSEAINAINKKLTETNKQVLVLPTGGGKTVVFSHIIAERTKDGSKALIIAHREELLTQAQDKLKKVAPELTSAIEQAAKTSNGEQVIIASVATIGREGSSRIEKFDPSEFKTIIIDEAHHASAPTYKNVLEYFGVLKNEKSLLDDELGGEEDTAWNTDCLLLGVTATPNRMDNEGIDQIFDDTAYTYGMIEAIQDGWLSNIRAYRVDTATTLEGVKLQGGDFQTGELGDRVNNEERNKLVVKTYLDQFHKKQALVFAVDVDHAKSLHEEFDRQKIVSAIITGETNKEQRERDLSMFHGKIIQVVINCMVLTEGYDNETIDVIMMARPTKSGILYSQMIGRGTRLHVDKPYLTVCDFVDNTLRHRIKTASSLLGIEAPIQFAGQDILEAKAQIDKIRELAPDYDLSRLDLSKIDYIMEEVDVLSGLQTPEEIAEVTTNAWHKYGIEKYRLQIGEYRQFVVEMLVTGQWHARIEFWNPKTKKTTRINLGECQTSTEAVQRVDRFLVNNYPEALKLVSLTAKWRFDKPSEKQIATLKRFGIQSSVLESLDKGKAAQLMTKLFTLKEREKKGGLPIINAL